MTSSNGNIFRVTRHLCGESTGHRWIPLTKASDTAMTSQIPCVSTACWTVCSSADQMKHQSYALMAFVRRIHRWSVDSPHKGLVSRQMFPFDDVIMVDKLNKLLNKHSSCCWSETPRSSWYYDVTVTIVVSITLTWVALATDGRDGHTEDNQE